MSVPESTPGATPPGKGQTIRLDFDSLEFPADPYPLYHRRRAADPVHRNPWGDRYLTLDTDVMMALNVRRFRRESTRGATPPRLRAAGLGRCRRRRYNSS